IGACVGHPMNVCAANSHVYANLLAWSAITSRLYIWHYSTDFANYLQPLPDLDEIAGDIPLFLKHGVVGVFYEGDYAQGGGGEMSELKAYLMARLLWNPAADAEQIISEFVEGVYGPAAPYIARWLEALRAQVRDTSVRVGIYDPPNAPYLPDSLLAEGESLFDAAEQAASHDRTALHQVERARLALEYVRLMRLSPDSAQHKGLARKVAAKIKRYRISQIREGEPVAKFLARIA
ncbi:MAG TPA: DUF4838 domain-containing protein, partial [Chthonomonadales bacterium]|nr:DUF4838 domain-containing protein [Chthonomonadales bacterium]